MQVKLQPALVAEWLGFLRTTAATRGGTHSEISQHRILNMEKKSLPSLLSEIEPPPSDHESGA